MKAKVSYMYNTGFAFSFSLFYALLLVVRQALQSDSLCSHTHSPADT